MKDSVGAAADAGKGGESKWDRARNAAARFVGTVAAACLVSTVMLPILHVLRVGPFDRGWALGVVSGALVAGLARRAPSPASELIGETGGEG